MNKKNMKIRFFPKDTSAIEATDWVTTLKSKPKTPEMEAQLHDWLSEKSVNKMELDLMDAIWDYSDVLNA